MDVTRKGVIYLAAYIQRYIMYIFKSRDLAPRERCSLVSYWGNLNTATFASNVNNCTMHGAFHDFVCLRKLRY